MSGNEQHGRRALTIALVALHTSPLAAPGSGEAGGLNVYLKNTARELAALGHSIYLVTRKGHASLPDEQRVGEGVTAVYLEAGPVSPMSKAGSETLIEPFRDAFDKWISKRNDIDLIHSHHWFAGVASIPVARNHRIKHVQSYHSLAAPEGTGLDGGEAAESPGRIPGEQLIATASDRIVAVSQFEKDLIVERCGADPAKVSIAAPGVEEIFKPAHRGGHAAGHLSHPTTDKPDSAGPYFVFAGRLHPLKGPDLILKALSLMTPDSRPRLILTGDPASGYEHYLDELRDLVEHLGLETKVERRSSLSREKLAELLQGAMFLVNPSHLETYGIINVEAQACGIPVIASKVGGMTESVLDGKTGYLIEERDPMTWTRYMERLVSNDELRHELGRNARAFALSRQWSDVAAELDVIYQGEAL